MPRQIRKILPILVFLGITQGFVACNPTQATTQPPPGITETPAQIQSPQIETTTEEPQIDTPVPILE